MTERSLDGRRSAAALRRRQREAEIIAATRTLFDARGVRDAQIEDIAKAVGINRAIVYRRFTGKEELFALTLVAYLNELREALAGAVEGHDDPRERLTSLVGAFVDYGLAHPAFVDCAQTLMRRTGPELLLEISESALFRLGRAISGCLVTLSDTLDHGVHRGVFTVTDPHLLANTLYASGLGALQLARVGILVKEAAPGIPTVGTITPDQVRDYVVATALALATTVSSGSCHEVACSAPPRPDCGHRTRGREPMTKDAGDAPQTARPELPVDADAETVLRARNDLMTHRAM